MNIHEGQLTLTKTETVARDTLRLKFSVKLRNDDTNTLNFVPGQFISIEFGPKAWRAYSIASTPEEAELELVVRLIEGGVASEIFRSMQAGDQLNFKGPFGMFGLSDNENATLNFCATGTGIAPFRPMIMAETAKPDPRPMRLFYGGRDAEDLAYLDEIKAWSEDLEVFLGLSRDPNPENHLLIPGSNCKQHRITQFLEDTDFTDQDEFYLCGSGPMVLSVNEILAEKEVPKERVFQERFN